MRTCEVCGGLIADSIGEIIHNSERECCCMQVRAEKAEAELENAKAMYACELVNTVNLEDKLKKAEAERDEALAEVERMRETERFWHAYSELAASEYPTDHARWMEKARGVLTEEDE